MSESDCAAARERAHEAHTMFLNKIRKANAGDVALAMGVSDSKVSELKNKQMQDCLLLLAHLGLKLVPANYQCMPSDTHRFLVQSHQLVVQKAPHLLFGGEEP